MANSSGANVVPTFEQLPAEVRIKIWLATFESRTLSLKWYEQKVPSPKSGQYAALWAQNFTVRLGLHIDQVSVDEARRQPSLNPQITFAGASLMSDEMGIKPPSGPVALHVCHENRELALQHYGMYLPGSLSYPGYVKHFGDCWAASAYSQPRMWVNPELDLIFLSTMSRDLSSPFAAVDAQFFRARAPLEITKFERLAFMNHTADPGNLSVLGTFTGLRVLVLFLTHRARAVKHEAEAGWDDYQNAEIAEAVREYLVEAKEIHEQRNGRGLCYTQWVAPTPRVTVWQDIGWHRDASGKLILRPKYPLTTGCHV